VASNKSRVAVVEATDFRKPTASLVKLYRDPFLTEDAIEPPFFLAGGRPVWENLQFSCAHCTWWSAAPFLFSVPVPSSAVTPFPRHTLFPLIALAEGLTIINPHFSCVENVWVLKGAFRSRSGMDRGTCCAVYIDNRVNLERWIRKESEHALEASPSEPSSCSLLGESAELRGNVKLLLEVFKQGNVFLEIVFHS
jgi:hypothetical protein